MAFQGEDEDDDRSTNSMSNSNSGAATETGPSDRVTMGVNERDGDGMRGASGTSGILPPTEDYDVSGGRYGRYPTDSTNVRSEFGDMDPYEDEVEEIRGCGDGDCAAGLGVMSEDWGASRRGRRRGLDSREDCQDGDGDVDLGHMDGEYLSGIRTRGRSSTAVSVSSDTVAGRSLIFGLMVPAGVGPSSEEETEREGEGEEEEDGGDGIGNTFGTQMGGASPAHQMPPQYLQGGGGGVGGAVGGGDYARQWTPTSRGDAGRGLETGSQLESVEEQKMKMRMKMKTGGNLRGLLEGRAIGFGIDIGVGRGFAQAEGGATMDLTESEPAEDEPDKTRNWKAIAPEGLDMAMEMDLGMQ